MKRLLPALFVLVILFSGVSTVSASPKIVGGQDAAPGSWPFYVALSKNKNFFCGGQLVDPEWVLTAAHCVASSFSGNRFTPGLHRMKDLGKVPSIGDAETYFHPRRGSGQKPSWDAALVHLERPSDGAVIALASESPRPGAQVLIGGFGALDDFGLKSPRIMQELTLSAVADQRCHELYGSYMPGSYDIESMICLFKRRKGACYGDSGGPAVFNDELVGLTSFGRGGCANAPAVFVRASALKPWVERVIAAGWQPGRITGRFSNGTSKKRYRYIGVTTSQAAKEVTYRVTRNRCRNGCPTETVRGRNVRSFEYVNSARIRLRPGRCARIVAEARFLSPDRQNENTSSKSFRVCKRR